MSRAKLDKIAPIITKVVDGEDISAKESEEVFTQIFLHDKKGYHYAILASSLHAKGETADELLGLCLASQKLGNKIRLRVASKKIIDVSGTGGGFLKTFNVSTTASFIAAVAGYTVPKESFYSITSPTGSADLFAAFGVNIAELSAAKIKRTLEKVGICATYAPFISPNLKARGTLFRQALLNNGIKIRTPFHLTSNLSTSVKMHYRLYGCYSEKYLEIIAQLLSKLGFKKSLTVYGFPGIPEISNVGPTTIVEQIGPKLKKYTLNPRDLGVRKARPKDIQTGGKDQNIIDFLRILKGQEVGPKADLTAVNAGAAFYVLGDVKSFKEGTVKAKGIIKSGQGFKKLEELVNTVGDKKLLNDWKQKI